VTPEAQEVAGSPLWQVVFISFAVILILFEVVRGWRLGLMRQITRLIALGAAYAATGLELPIAGRYQVQVQVRRSDTLADLAYDFEFSVPRAASPTPSVARSVVTVTTTTTATPLASDSPSVILALLATLGFFAIILAGLLAWRRR